MSDPKKPFNDEQDGKKFDKNQRIDADFKKPQAKEDDDGGDEGGGGAAKRRKTYDIETLFKMIRNHKIDAKDFDLNKKFGLDSHELEKSELEIQEEEAEEQKELERQHDEARGKPEKDKKEERARQESKTPGAEESAPTQQIPTERVAGQSNSELGHEIAGTTEAAETARKAATGRLFGSNITGRQAGAIDHSKNLGVSTTFDKERAKQENQEANNNAKLTQQKNQMKAGIFSATKTQSTNASTSDNTAPTPLSTNNNPSRTR